MAGMATKLPRPGSKREKHRTPAGDAPWHHLPDGRFRNPPGSPNRTAGLKDMLPFMERMFRQSFRDIDVPDHHVLPRPQALASLDRARSREHEDRGVVTWLGHASFLLRIGGKTILTDPYLTSYAGPVGFGPKRYVPSGIAIRDLPEIDILAISHNHYDHLDETAIHRLPGKETMTVVAPLGLGDFFRERGFRYVVDMDWYQSLTVNDLTVKALPCIHWSRRSGLDTNRSLWAAFSFEGPEGRVFFGGDTAYGPVFEEIGAREGPFDLALIGIGAYEPRAIMKASHANPEEAVQIGIDIGARTLVGMHWGTVVLTEEPPFEPPERFLRAGRERGFADDDVWIMRIGETRFLPRKHGDTVEND